MGGTWLLPGRCFAGLEGKSPPSLGGTAVFFNLRGVAVCSNDLSLSSEVARGEDCMISAAESRFPAILSSEGRSERLASASNARPSACSAT